MIVSDTGRLPPAGVGGLVTDVTAAPPASAGGSRPASLATPRTLWPRERQKQPTKRARNAAGVAKAPLAWPKRPRVGAGTTRGAAALPRRIRHRPTKIA